MNVVTIAHRQGLNFGFFSHVKLSFLFLCLICTSLIPFWFFGFTAHLTVYVFILTTTFCFIYLAGLKVLCHILFYLAQNYLACHKFVPSFRVLTEIALLGPLAYVMHSLLSAWLISFTLPFQCFVLCHCVMVPL